MKTQQENNEEVNETELAAKTEMIEAVHEFFTWVSPNQDELKELFWDMLLMTMTNPDYMGTPSYNMDLMFTYRRLCDMLDALRESNEVLRAIRKSSITN
jgi:hypothetical protein